MKFNGGRLGEYLYRVRVLSYPPGSYEDVDFGAEIASRPVPGWQPPGWRPIGNYTQILGTDQFVWPVTNKVYGSRATAKNRADLLESYGAVAVVERSDRITWPDDTPEKASE